MRPEWSKSEPQRQLQRPWSADLEQLIQLPQRPQRAQTSGERTARLTEQDRGQDNLLRVTGAAGGAGKVRMV